MVNDPPRNVRNPLEYGIDVRALLDRFGVPRTQISDVLAEQGLPSPTLYAVMGWVSRGTISLHWLIVIAVALKRRGVVIDLADLARNNGKELCES